MTEVAAIVLAALLAAGAVAFVARPFVLAEEAEDAVVSRRAEEAKEEEERLRLTEERDRTLAALKELEFDHRTGKIADEDYRALVGPLRRQAAEALRALEPRPAERSPDAPERVDARA